MDIFFNSAGNFVCASILDSSRRSKQSLDRIKAGSREEDAAARLINFRRRIDNAKVALTISTLLAST
eukprot:CAMPEP_0195272118 /NCGR_PEP_ID=MMETSP0706-20130129/15556_1 /TAXON_ID=33640 /ORGANISM="Asterionellopsis glacialis, Strain CCMP134" /LENGTH=66 /DNA_ID=CAMNT_0040328121 /DNA_START=189 /DNA_END=389 /DNA_ORIENTATION=+